MFYSKYQRRINGSKRLIFSNAHVVEVHNAQKNVKGWTTEEVKFTESYLIQRQNPAISNSTFARLRNTPNSR